MFLAILFALLISHQYSHGIETAGLFHRETPSHSMQNELAALVIYSCLKGNVARADVSPIRSRSHAAQQLSLPEEQMGADYKMLKLTVCISQ